jgi:hypothetical protein
MKNKAILYLAKCSGAFPADFVRLIEDHRHDGKTGLRGHALRRCQGGLHGIEHHATQGALDLAEEAVLDRMPLRGIGRIVRDARCQPQAALSAMTSSLNRSEDAALAPPASKVSTISVACG